MKARSTKTFKPFTKGDRVWLEARNLQCSLASPKLGTKREGPFTIIDVLSPIAYKLRLSKTWHIHNVFHASLLSPYHENPVYGPNFPSPPPDLIEGEEEYKIEKII
jgi:hypothetical protein